MIRHVLLLLAATLLMGCATVSPWQRELLSHPCMQVTPRLGDTFGGHVTAVREGTLPTTGLGGGCGCG